MSGYLSKKGVYISATDVGTESSPTYTGMTLSGLTASTLIYSNASKAFTSLANSAGFLLNDGSGGLSYAAALKPDGTIPLTADWNVGAFDLTCVDMNATRMLVGNGSADTPAIVAASDTNTGIYFDGADNLYLVSAAQAALRIYGASAIAEWLSVTNQVKITGQNITAGTGTGLTVNSTGHVNRQVYKVTVTYAGFAAAALTADHTIATLPAKTKIVGFYADTTTPFTGGGVTAAALTVGKSAGGVEYIATHDVLSGAVTKGLADADMGTELAAAALIQGGAVVNWTATTPVSARITTVTANTDQLTAGSVTFYIITERL